MPIRQRGHPGRLGSNHGAAFQKWEAAFCVSRVPASRRRRPAPVVLTVREAGGRLLALPPMTLRRKGGVRLLEAAHLGVSDYAAPVIRADARPLLEGAGAAIGAVLPGHDVLRIEPLAMRYFRRDPGDYVRPPCDKELCGRIADVYRRNDCWTWAEDWAFFDEECYMEAPAREEGVARQSHLFPLNLFTIDDRPRASRVPLVAGTAAVSAMIGAALMEAF